MGRRRMTPAHNRHVDGQRASIGDYEVNVIAEKLRNAACKECALHVTTEYPVKKLIPMLFPDELVEKLTAVSGYVKPNSAYGYYELGGDRKLRLEFTGAGLPTPTQDAMAIHIDRSREFLADIGIMAQIREKYAAVTHLVRWFNRNATPAAIRALWPSILSLAPGSPLCREYADMPTRYSAPDGIAPLLPLLRDTATTVAGMQLLPSDAVARPSGSTLLTFEATTFMRADIAISADPFNLFL